MRTLLAVGCLGFLGLGVTVQGQADVQLIDPIVKSEPHVFSLRLKTTGLLDAEHISRVVVPGGVELHFPGAQLKNNFVRSNLGSGMVKKVSLRADGNHVVLLLTFRDTEEAATLAQHVECILPGPTQRMLEVSLQKSAVPRQVEKTTQIAESVSTVHLPQIETIDDLPGTSLAQNALPEADLLPESSENILLKKSLPSGQSNLGHQSFGMLLKGAAVLLLVLLGFGVKSVIKRGGGFGFGQVGVSAKTSSSVGAIRIKSRKFIDPKKSLATVQVQTGPGVSQWFLVGIGTDGFAMLSELDMGDEEVQPFAPEAKAAPSSRRDTAQNESFQENLDSASLIPNVQAQIQARLGRLKHI
jgi:hypothetical protein